MSSSGDQVAAVRVLARLARMLDSVESGLTLPQYRILAGIADGGVRSAILAERLSVRRPTLTAIVDGLVTAGYARRETEAGDRRVVNVSATEAGQAVLASADQAYRARLAPILDGMADADRFVTDLLAVGAVLDARMQARLEPVAADAGRTPAVFETTEAAL